MADELAHGGEPRPRRPAARTASNRGSDEDRLARWEGRDAWRIEAGLTWCAALRAGELDVVSDDHQALAGREPLPLREIVRRLASP